MIKRVLYLLVAALGVAINLNAAILPAEKLLPDDTLVVWSIPDAAKARESYKDSPQGRFWNDPAMKPFKDKFVNKLRDTYLTPLEHDLGVHFEDYQDLAQGQFTLALTQNSGSAKDQQPNKAGTALLLVDVRDKSSQLKTNLTDLKKKWVDSGKSVRTEKIRDVEFSIVTIPSKDKAKFAAKKKSGDDASADEPASDDADTKKQEKREVYIGQSDSLLIMGDSAKSIEKVLAAMGGASVKSLSEVPAFAASQSSVLRDAPVWIWLNAKALVEIAGHLDDDVQETDSDINPFSNRTAKILGAVGLNGLKTVACAARRTEDGTQFTVALNVPEEGRSGIFKLLAGDSKDTLPPAFVPADAVGFTRWRMSGQKAWDTVQKMLTDYSPQALNGVNMLLKMAERTAKEKDPDFDINKSLFGNLGDDFITYSKAPKGHSVADLNSPPSIYLLASPNPEQLASALKGLLTFAAQEATPKEREFLGKKIYSLQLPSRGDDDAPPRSLNYTSSGGYVALSADSAILEEYLRSTQDTGKSLRDANGLKDAAQKVAGSDASLFSYSNDSETKRALVEMLRANGDSPEFARSIMPLAYVLGIKSPEQVKEWVDPTLLPAFDKIARIFHFTVCGWNSTSEGLTFKVYAPTPPQLKK